MTNFEEYIRQPEPHKREKGYAWQTAIGLQAVDGLKTSDYLIETARQHIEGDITIEEAQERIKNYYQSKTVRTNDSDDTEEADKVSANIAKLLSERSFAFTVVGFTAVHRRIFDGVFKFAGKIRDYNITKKEWVLDGDTVLYVSAPDLRDAIGHDLEQEKAFDYTGLNMEQVVSHITKFVSGLWQIHPFGEGNTRTVAVFAIQYLRSMGFDLENNLFANHSWYFRNALVRANYQNVQKGVSRNLEYLELFFRNLLMGETNELKNKYLLVSAHDGLSGNEKQTGSQQKAIQIATKPNMTNENRIGKILIYQNEKGNTRIDVFFQDGEIWMTQKSLAELYQVSIKTVSEHIKNIIDEGELQEEATIRKFRIVQQEGERMVEREPFHYNFQMILAIGYRVRSRVGVHFRNWASRILTEYTQKGFAMNDERLKNPKPFGVDYFDELLERIREIRTSEKRFYEKIKEIYKTSVDYDKDDEKAKLFFQTVQNKLHYGVHGHTAAELIALRADASKDNMGLTSFEGAKVRKKDVHIAKNYLNKDEINGLNRLVTMYLDYAEDQAMQHNPMHMTDWERKLNDFLSFTGRKILDNSGRVSSEQAKQIAESQYEQYDDHRKEQEKNLNELLQEADKIKKKKQ